MRQLLNHTSGIPDYYDTWFYLFDWDTDEPITPRLVLATIKGDEAVNKPGEAYHYSNTNFHVLAAVLEAVYKEPLEQLLEKKLLAPLGLSQTTYNGQFSQGDMIHGYGAPIAPWGSPLFSWVDTYDWRENSGPDGGMFSDVEDLNRWLRAIYSPNGELKALGEEMLRSPLRVSERKSQGLGTEILVSKSGAKVIGHTGANDGYLTASFYIPSIDSVCIFHMNYSDVDGFNATLGALISSLLNAKAS